MLSLIDFLGLVNSAPRIKLITGWLLRKWGETGGKVYILGCIFIFAEGKNENARLI